MKLIQNILCIIALLSSVDSMSCQYGGKAACIASCMAQNCATGYCLTGHDQICVCTRCGTGPPIPH